MAASLKRRGDEVMTQKSWISMGLGGALAIGLAQMFRSPMAQETALGQPSPAPRQPEVLFSAPGLSEPRSRSVDIICEQSGTLKAIHVRAGDMVRRGQVLAELNRDLQQAQVDLAEAAVDRAAAELARLQNGERPEEREIIRAQLEEARALRGLAEFEWQRVQGIMTLNAATQNEIARVRSALDQTLARERAAEMRCELIEAGPREEDLIRAQAALREARAQLDAARSLLARTYIRSPLDGMVIYRYREPGEAVFTDSPSPILSIGDRGTLHVRVDVDETDIGRIWPGQKAYAVAPAFGSRRFSGRVVHIEPTLGRKNFRTGRPTEKIDTRIQEVVVALEDAELVPLELQMDVWFLDEPKQNAAESRQVPSRRQAVAEDIRRR